MYISDSRYIYESLLFISFYYLPRFFFFFFFNDTATTEIYTLSLHDALPIYVHARHSRHLHGSSLAPRRQPPLHELDFIRSEEHTSELQSQSNLVCRLLLEKKKNKTKRKMPQDNKQLVIIERHHSTIRAHLLN